MPRNVFWAPTDGAGSEAPPAAPSASPNTAGSGLASAGENASAPAAGSPPAATPPPSPQPFLEYNGRTFASRDELLTHLNQVGGEANRARLLQPKLSSLEKELAEARRQLAEHGKRAQATEAEDGYDPTGTGDIEALKKELAELKSGLPTEFSRHLAAERSISEMSNRIVGAMEKVIHAENSPVAYADLVEAGELAADIMRENGINPHDPNHREAMATAVDQALIQSHQRRLAAQEKWMTSPAGQHYLKSKGLAQAAADAGKGNGQTTGQPGPATTLPGTGVTPPAPGQAVGMEELKGMSNEDFGDFVISRHAHELQ